VRWALIASLQRSVPGGSGTLIPLTAILQPPLLRKHLFRGIG
jgi:hypothetical protein